jgi:hypothetical protein
MRPPATHVWLEPFDQVEDAEAMVNTRYQQLVADDPATISSGTRSSDRIRMGSCSQRWSPPLNGLWRRAYSASSGMATANVVPLPVGLEMSRRPASA